MSIDDCKNGDVTIEVETLNKFMRDCDNINWLRGYLHEQHKNYWLPMQEASNMLYHNHLPDIKKLIFDFADKWHFSINDNYLLPIPRNLH